MVYSMNLEQSDNTHDTHDTHDTQDLSIQSLSPSRVSLVPLVMKRFVPILALIRRLGQSPPLTVVLLMSSMPSQLVMLTMALSQLRIRRLAVLMMSTIYCVNTIFL